eukprot:351027-Chlamydomonas_euryale.AAC.1
MPRWLQEAEIALLRSGIDSVREEADRLAGDRSAVERLEATGAHTSAFIYAYMYAYEYAPGLL